MPEVGVFLLPPPSDLCQECACDHHPDVPHNRQSLYYGVWFRMRHDRGPTWLDAMAHCDQAMRDRWILALRERGVEVEK